MYHLLVDLGWDGEIIFIKRADLAVLKQGLEVTKGSNFSPTRKESINTRHEMFAISKLWLSSPRLPI